MSITQKDAEHAARLARLALTDEEKQNFTSQLGKILEYVEKLKELNTSSVPPCAHPFFTDTVWREDKTIQGQESGPILANAPEREDSFFKVRKVIE